MINLNQKEIGKRIKLIRESQGLTRKEFAEKLNVTERTVANYEQGQRGSNTKVLNKIADALNVSIDAILLDGNVKKL
ncbi:XRE family transcriptional regulator [Clostridium septicum]|nr:XRE family transcriptional regulator [Clostridium septicum]